MNAKEALQTSEQSEGANRKQQLFDKTLKKILSIIADAAKDGRTNTRLKNYDCEYQDALTDLGYEIRHHEGFILNMEVRWD